MNPHKDRKARVRRIRRENTKVTRLDWGKYRVDIVLAHQSFEVRAAGFDSRKRAEWYTTQIAIALNRFKFGD